MAVDVKFSICQESNCKAIKFTEKTGVYNAVSNTTGWGAPNETTGDAVSATLTLTSPSGSVYSIDLFTVSSFPKDDTKASYSIDASLFDTSLTSFEDGYWETTYSVTTSTKTYSEKQTLFFHCKIDSCISKKVAALDVDDCECDHETIDAVLRMKAYSDALSYAVGCGNLSAANEILKTLKRLCDCTSC